MAQGLDLTHLDQWIRDHVPAFQGDLKAEKFAGGQSNPTFKLTAGENSYVLRRKPMGTLLASAHAVDREFKVLSALAPTNRCVGSCQTKFLISPYPAKKVYAHP